MSSGFDDLGCRGGTAGAAFDINTSYIPFTSGDIIFNAGNDALGAVGLPGDINIIGGTSTGGGQDGSVTIESQDNGNNPGDLNFVVNGILYKWMPNTTPPAKGIEIMAQTVGGTNCFAGAYLGSSSYMNCALNNTGQVTYSLSPGVINFPNINENIGNITYNTGTGVFTLQSSRVYFINFIGFFRTDTVSQLVNFQLEDTGGVQRSAVRATVNIDFDKWRTVQLLSIYSTGGGNPTQVRIGFNGNTASVLVGYQGTGVFIKEIGT